MACGLDLDAAWREGGPACCAEVPANAPARLPEFEQDEDTVIRLVEDGQASTLYDLINEAGEAEMLKPGVQRYTVDIKTTDLIDLSTGWCAKDEAADGGQQRSTSPVASRWMAT